MKEARARAYACQILDDASDMMNLGHLTLAHMPSGRSFELQRARRCLTRLMRRGWVLVLPDSEVWLVPGDLDPSTRHPVDPATLQDDSLWTFDGPDARGGELALELTDRGEAILFAHWRARPEHHERG
jgi:hypothetical protein